MPEYVYALHDFAPEHDDEVPFRAGEQIEVVEKDDLYGDGWWQGRNTAGRVGLFPMTYTTSQRPGPPISSTPPASPSAAITQNDIRSPLQALTEESDTMSTRSNSPERAKSEHETNGVMKATLTDVQEAIEQLGRNDRDGGASFSFSSNHNGDTTDHETEAESERETDRDDETWHKGTRRSLAEKARAETERRAEAERAALRVSMPPIEVEVSDESEDEEDHVHVHGFHSRPRRNSHITEEDAIESEVSPQSIQSLSNPYSAGTDLHSPSSTYDAGGSSSPDRRRSAPDEMVQTATARRTSFPSIEPKTPQPRLMEEPTPPTPTSPTRMASPPPPTAIALTNSEDSTKTESYASISTSITATSLPSPPPSSPGTLPNPYLVSPLDTQKSSSTNPMEWTVEEVVEWAKSKKLDQSICDKFIEHEITGDVLMDLDVNLLKTELEIAAFGKRMRIANAIAELRRPPSSPSSFEHGAGPQFTQALASPAPQLLSSPMSAVHGNGNGFATAGMFSPNTSIAVGELRSMSPSVFLSAPSSPPATPGLNGSERAASPTNGSRGLMGLGITASATSPGMLEAAKITKNRPSQLNLSPSDGALHAHAKAATELIPEEGEELLEDARSVLSEGETARTSDSHSRRRRIFGRSTGSTMSNEGKDSKDNSSRNSREATTPVLSSMPASPSTTKRGSTDDASTSSIRRARVKKSVDASKPTDRLSLFGMGSLGKARKPPPRYSSSNSYGSEDTVTEKPGRSLSRLYMGSHSKKSSRPSTADSSRGFGKFGEKLHEIEQPVKEKEPEKEKRRDSDSSAVLRKRTASTAETPQTPTAAAHLKPGQSVLEQIGQPDHNGWMSKKGERYNSWKTRYFVLKGPHLYYLKSNSAAETRIKGYINIIGYKVIVDENVNPGKYGFRLIHDSEKTHFFSSDEQGTVREWMKALMKATIGRDYSKPVISSCNIPTIPLAVAQTMSPAPRPPSPTARDATQKALRRDNPNQLSTRDARVLMGLPSTDANGVITESERTRTNSFFTIDTVASNPDEEDPRQSPPPVLPAPPRPARQSRMPSSPSYETEFDADLINWANGYLPQNLQMHGPLDAPYGGLALFRLAESVKGTASEPPVPDSAFPTDANDNRLDGLFKLFDFLLDNEIRIGGVTLNDVRQGKGDKVMQLVRSLRTWEEKRRAIARTIGRGLSASAGPFMAVSPEY